MLNSLRHLALAACLSVIAGLAQAAEITGTPRIVDGDTVEIGKTKIRMLGIDAPETDQLCLDANGQKWACGVASREALVAFTSNRLWTCHVNGHDRYGRSLASCSINGQDVDQWMVRSGWALAFVKYSNQYVAEEAKARNERAGLWAGAFIAPWDWRSRNKRTLVLGAVAVPVNAQAILLGAVSSQEAPDPSCTIKAGVSRGECIYHLAGDRWYAKMKMDKPDRRWFCTPNEAEAAGCRPPKH
jgi:endonuclease YncB( thermonuclease family)